jgi:pimeloyl-ACP methyl ester carboxylesterase
VKRFIRRLAFLVLPLALLVAEPARAEPAVQDQNYPPIVFVHGNGDTALPWATTVWRFESNGWPRDRLHAFNMPYPLARDDDAVPQEGRSSSNEYARALADEVHKVLLATGAKKVVLVGNSRGGTAIRNFIANGGGDQLVSHAILGASPNHGVWSSPTLRYRSEFNGAGPFLTGLNAPKGADGNEVSAGVRWLTLRSNNNDKFAQPDGEWIGVKGAPTHVNFDGPALKGATNLVLPGRDHRELSFHPESFAQTYTFITGKPPSRLDIVREEKVTLNGQVLALQPATNQPLTGASVDVYAVDAATGARLGKALLSKKVGGDGQWGPVQVYSLTALEFVVQAAGYSTVHFYRGPQPRSSEILQLRVDHLPEIDRNTGAVIVLSRVRGYFGVPRDAVIFDGHDPAPGIPTGVASVNTSKLKLDDGRDRPVVAEFHSGSTHERLVGRTWPAAQDHVSVLELSN